jgi:hypothetical protein
MEINGTPNTICQNIRNVYHGVSDEKLRYTLRVCLAMAKAMNARLKEYKGGKDGG